MLLLWDIVHLYFGSSPKKDCLRIAVRIRSGIVVRIRSKNNFIKRVIPLITYLILVIIVAYSGWTLYKSVKNKIAGQCDSACSGCSLNGACPVQSVKKEEIPLILK